MRYYGDSSNIRYLARYLQHYQLVWIMQWNGKSINVFFNVSVYRLLWVPYFLFILVISLLVIYFTELPIVHRNSWHNLLI